MNYFDSLKAMFGGTYDPQQMNEMYGVPQGMVDQARSSQLLQAGMGMIAAGQQLTPAQRAQAMQSIGSSAGTFDKNIYNAAQSRLMSERNKLARDKDSREQQAMAQLLETIKGLPDDDPRKQRSAVYLQMGDTSKAVESLYGGSDTRTGLMPVPITNADGTPGYVLPRTDGTGQPLQLPEGAKYYSPENLEQAKSSGRASGKAQGEARAMLPAAGAKMERALKLVDSIIDDPALDSAIGPIQSKIPDFAAEFLTPGVTGLRRKLDQAAGTAFLEAYQTLKGAGPITDIEGVKAEAAIARLNQSQDEASFRAALADFKEAITLGYQKLRTVAGVAADEPVQQQQTTPKADPLNIRK